MVASEEQLLSIYRLFDKDGSGTVMHFEMEQKNLEMQTEELAEHLEKDVAEIHRMDVVHCFQMAKKRLNNLMELVEAESSRRGEAGSSSSSSGGAAGSSSDNPMVV